MYQNKNIFKLNNAAKINYSFIMFPVIIWVNAAKCVGHKHFLSYFQKPKSKNIFGLEKMFLSFYKCQVFLK